MSPSADQDRASVSVEKQASETQLENAVPVHDVVDAPPMLTPEQEKRLWRKVDLRLMPILSLMYLLSFMDRGNIGNAKLDGLTTQLHLTGNKYNIALTMFFIPYCLFECPANLVLKVFRPSR
ncbi:hypothetical protein HYDPIDRAFT_40046 [Hydnomerulius pinastri MD-312]|uniref:Major facilitator superfamily (MFS) profile domain-containing protein n=1 Tax=Hydnomerulius pinastri MD-312 TaxID=994086 RepID=A0A0C9WFI3_9AGAM|nr:hypothetical protein HYDPIDRAFT_40046 [Hydnomerulius pinastri MD-312]